MSPERRFGVTLLASLALWYPTLQELLASNVSLATALVRYAIGLGVAWFAVAGINRLLSGYRDANLARTRVARIRRFSDRRADQPPEIAGPDSDAPA
jgi:hypothetical protein